MPGMNTDPTGQGNRADQQPDEVLEPIEQATEQQLPPAVGEMAVGMPPSAETGELATDDVSPADPAVEWGTQLILQRFGGQQLDTDTRQKLVRLIAANEELQVTLAILLKAGSEVPEFTEEQRTRFAGLYDRLARHMRQRQAPQPSEAQALPADEPSQTTSDTPADPTEPTK